MKTQLAGSAGPDAVTPPNSGNSCRRNGEGAKVSRGDIKVDWGNLLCRQVKSINDFMNQRKHHGYRLIP